MSIKKWLTVIGASLLLLTGCATYAPPPSGNSAVVSLLEQAQTATRGGDYDRAGTALERALRIEPRNPLLWQELARVRIDQQQFVQAENLAKKSNSLSRGDRELRRRNWQIISLARRLNGDDQGAKDAQQRAARE